MRMLILISFLIAPLALGADAKSSFDAGDYTSAAKTAEEQLLTSRPNAEGYYNLGLAYEKSGDLIKAMLNYERALLLDPGLRPARYAVAKLASSKSLPMPPHRWTDDVIAVVHPDTLVVVGTSLVWVGVFGLFFASLSGRRRVAWNTFFTLALLVGCACVVIGWLSDMRMSTAKLAIVSWKDGAEILTAPANNSTPVISLPPGTPIQVLSPRGTWTYVNLNDGARGWVQTERLTPIIPSETL